MIISIEEKRIKLAEFHGYKPCPETGLWYFCFAETCGFKEGIKPLPDYFNDLDAVHELEKLLTFHQETVYIANLMRQHKEYPMTKGFMASASQRCEALGKTLNLW